MGARTLFGKVKRGFVLKSVLWGTKGIAKGKFGRGPQKAWVLLEGWKTYISVAFMVSGYVLDAAYGAGICEQCPSWGESLMGLATFGAYIGLVDGANREPSAQDERSTGQSARGR